MGLLDDAIREHLELKRRRGADASEVTRQEQEAFGAPRRGDFEVGAAPESHGAAGHEQPELDEPAAFAAEPAATGLHAVDAEPAPAEPQPLQDEPPRPHGDPADDLPPAIAAPAPLRAADPEPQAEPPRPHGDPADDLPEVEQATRAFDADEVRAATTPPPVAPPPAEAAQADGEDEPEDVLEETPEFLQETPEHDRLWFEQRPPRDFDF